MKIQALLSNINGILKKSAVFALIIALFIVMMPPFCMEAFAGKTVWYYVPVYNVDGDPTSGIKSWTEKYTDSYASINTSRAVLNESVYYLGESLKYDGSIEIEGNVTLIMDYDVTLEAHQIHVPENSSLTIYGKDRYSSKILISGGEKGEAGIGGDKNQNNGSITINKCEVKVYRKKDAAGIGGGEYGTGKHITLNDCNTEIPDVDETLWLDEDRGAGIGGGEDRSGEDIVVNGGKTNIYGSRNGGAGIGGGVGGSGERIYVRNCDAQITSRDGGAGIGGGQQDGGGGNANNITVDNVKGKIAGEQFGEDSEAGAAIGGGYKGQAENIHVMNCKELILSTKCSAAVIGSGAYASANGITIDNCSFKGEYALKAVDCSAAIGAGDEGDAYNITIKNSTINATGGFDAAAIGGGSEGDGQIITIENSTVIAKGDNDGAGIGGGYKGNGRKINITNNSNVTAIGGPRAAGIGGGYKGDGSHMSITDSTVKATCGSTEDNIAANGGAGIGAGSTGEFAEIDITNSEVSASANGGGGEAIGKGKGGDYALEIRIDSKQTVTLDGTAISHNGGNLADKFSGKNTAVISCTLPDLEIQTGPVTPNPTNKKWYDSAVSYVKAKGLMKGVTDTDFDPLGTASRAMTVTVLWRIAGSPETSYKADFADTTGTHWYSDALNWAVENGVILGTDNSNFTPDRAVSREELVTMMYRYEKSLGKGFTGGWAFLLPQNDASSVHGWANEAMHWFVMKGIINGDNNNNLNPRKSATRAEMATIIMKYTK